MAFLTLLGLCSKPKPPAKRHAPTCKGDCVHCGECVLPHEQDTTYYGGVRTTAQELHRSPQD